jgi:hypothetical protein
MEIFFGSLLMLSFIMVIFPFGKRKSDKSGFYFLIYSYLFFLIAFSIFWYLVIFKEFYLGHELGDVIYYLATIIALIISNSLLGFRNKIDKETKLIISFFNIVISLFIIKLIILK